MGVFLKRNYQRLRLEPTRRTLDELLLWLRLDDELLLLERELLLDEELLLLLGARLGAL